MKSHLSKVFFGMTCLILAALVFCSCNRGTRGWIDLGPCIVCLDRLPVAPNDDSTGLPRNVIYMTKLKNSILRPKPIVVIDSTDDDSSPFIQNNSRHYDFDDDLDVFSDSLYSKLQPPIILEVSRDYNLYARRKGKNHQHALYHQDGDRPLIRLKRSEGWGESLHGGYHGFNYTGVTQKGMVIYARVPNIGNF